MDMDESDPMSLYSYLLQKLEPLNLAYVHLIEPRMAGGWDAKGSIGPSKSMATLFRPYYSGIFAISLFLFLVSNSHRSNPSSCANVGTIIIAGGFNPESARKVVEEGDADLVAFGRFFISNPDLPTRLKNNLPLNPYNRKTFYTPGSEGYTDYPFYSKL